MISLITARHDNQMSLLPETDVWYRTCPVANDVRATYQFFPQAEAATRREGPIAHFADYVHDPLNPKTYVFEKDEEDPDGFELTRSVIEMPNIAPQPLNEKTLSRREPSRCIA